jgi:hypothetical protein
MATVVGGMLIFAIPQAASAAPRSAQPVVSYHDMGDDKGSDSATAPKDTEPKKDAPGEGSSHYDKLHHDGDTF